MEPEGFKLADLQEKLTSVRVNRRAVLKRATAFGLGVPVVAGLLAACGGDDDDDDDDAGGSESTEAPSDSGEATSPADDDAETTEEPDDGGETPETDEPSGDAPELGGTLTIGLNQEPPTMDPHASPSAVTFTITSTAAESLLFMTADRELQPWLAESWEVADDGTSVTFQLRTDVTFQDGQAFNAEAVKWNFDRIVDPNFIAGAAAGAIDGYESSEAVDESTIVVNFAEPTAPFLNYAASPMLGMLSPQGTEEQGDAVNQTPITTGPYRVSEYVTSDRVVLTRWDDYGRQTPWSDREGPGFVDEIHWRFIPESASRMTTIETDETQMVTEIPAQDLLRFESSGDFTIEQQLWVGVPMILVLNVDRAPTDDQNVRLAINHAINKEVMIQTLIQGTGQIAYGQLSKALTDDPAIEAASQSYDPDRAGQLLDEAGWVMDGGDIRTKDGQPLEVVYNTIDYGGGADETTQLIQGQLRQVGIDAQITAQARAPYYEDNLAGAHNITSIFYRVGEYDALYPLFHSSLVGENFNWFHLSDPDVDAMLEEGRTTMDPDERRQIYIDLQVKLLELGVSVPLVDQFSTWVMRQNVSGLVFNGFSYPVVANMQVSE